MFQKNAKLISVLDTFNRYYMCKLLKPAKSSYKIIKKKVLKMSWKKTAIKIIMANQDYPDGIKIFTYNNIVENPTREQIKMLAEGLQLLSNGDAYLGSEVIKHDELSAD